MIDPLIGKTIGKYEIVAFIGRGATADVYKAYQPALERYVAVKVLHSFLSEDPDFLVRFQTEAKAAARLRHPNVVGVYDFDVLQGTYFLVMEFIEGITLKAKLQEITTQLSVMSLADSIHIVTQVATGLAYAHKNGLVHRDIKPANIMIGRDGQVILTDFGTAKIVGGLKHTASGVTVGTAAYASPEQVMAQPCDARSDLYSLGVVFFEMVTGQVPFQGDTGVAVFLKHLTDPIPSPRELNPALSPDVETFIYRAMAKKPDDRHSSAEELIEDLERITSNRSVSLPKPAAATPITDEIDRYAAALSAATSAAPPPNGEFQLTPYALSPGNVAKQLSDLPLVCDKDWGRAVNQFAKRYIEQWLRDGVKRLRAEHQHGLADDLETIANRAESIISKVADDDELGRNSALEEFLLSLGANPSVLQFSPARLEFPPVGVETIGRTIPLTITNQGRGYLFGEVSSRVEWLSVRSMRFGCAAGKSATVFVQPKLDGVPAGIHASEEALQIRSVAGQYVVPAQISITPAILDVDTNMLDLGVIGQGDDAMTTFMIRNRGAGFLVGSIESRFTWLQVWPKHFRIATGQEIQITADVDSLKWPANVQMRNQILSIASNGGNVTLGMRIHVDPPILRLDPPQLNWGTLDLSKALVNEQFDLKISNSGAGLLLGRLTSEESWLSIEPAAFRCSHGQSQSIRLSILNLKTGDYRQMVEVATNAEDFELPVQVRVVFSLEPETIRILPGPFWRGTPREQGSTLEDIFRGLFPSTRSRARYDYQPEQPQTEIFMTEYRLGKYPVTNAEYGVFVKTTGRRAPEHWKGGTLPPGLENYPVVNVSWHQARAYCFWLSEVTGKTYQLPTEAQWEKAARGSDARIFPWGNQWHKHLCNTLESNLRKPSEVGAFSPDGDSPYGCADMVGNVWEWTLDWYGKDYYARSTVTLDPLGPANGVVKVIRGGSFHTDAIQSRTTSRLYANASNPSPEVGFRVAMKID